MRSIPQPEKSCGSFKWARPCGVRPPSRTCSMAGSGLSPRRDSRSLRSRCPQRRAEENELARIPKVLHEHINTAFPINVCLVATVLPNGFAQVTPRGSTMVFDDEHLALWERGRGTTNRNLKDGTQVTVFFRKSELRQGGGLTKGVMGRTS